MLSTRPEALRMCKDGGLDDTGGAYGDCGAYGEPMGPVTDSAGDGLRPGAPDVRRSSISSVCVSPPSKVVYFFGLLFLHLSMPKPTNTISNKAMSMAIMTYSGTTTICL